MDTNIQIQVKISDIIMKDNEARKRIDYALQAAMFIIEDEYVKQAPGDTGAFKQGIQVKKDAELEYRVVSTARNKGYNYPLALFTGTGRMKGLPDFGFTTGRVRANQVAWGIGGIRPNKVATRAKKNSMGKFLQFVNSKIKLD